MNDSEPSRAHLCPACGALNGRGFSRCIRCQAPLSTYAQSAVRIATAPNPHALLATKVLGGVTFLVFAAQMIATAKRGLPMLGEGSIADALRFGAVVPRLDFALEEPWRLLSAMFVHYGPVHFFFNMLALVQLARFAEPAIGSARFTIAYVVTGLVGFATTILYGLSAHAFGTTAGASGALFGVMGMTLGWLVRRRDPRWRQFLVQGVIFSLLLGFALPRVNNSAHVGGLVTGIVLGLVYGGPRRARSEIWPNIGAALGIVACVLSLALAQLSPLWRQAEGEGAAVHRSGQSVAARGPADSGASGAVGAHDCGGA